MRLVEYNEEESLKFSFISKSEADRTYIIIDKLKKRATHILVFKRDKSLFSPKDTDISEWGEPVRVFDGNDLIQNRAGKLNIGGTVGEYFAAAAKLGGGGVYYCDKNSVAAFTAGTHASVLYSVARTRQTDCDKIAVSFKPAIKENNANFIPYNDILYIINRDYRVKYPISERMINNDMFEVFVPRDSVISLICAEGSRIQVNEI